MANMSYCRFENTLGDLSDCQDELFENGLDELSDTEKERAIELIQMCIDIAESHRDLLDT